MREKVYLVVLTLEVQGRSSTDSTMSGFRAFNSNNNNNNNETVEDALQMKGKAIKRLRGHKKKKKKKKNDYTSK